MLENNIKSTIKVLNRVYKYQESVSIDSVTSIIDLLEQSNSVDNINVLLSYCLLKLSIQFMKTLIHAESVRKGQVC